MSEGLRKFSAEIEATLFELDRLRRFRASIMADCQVNLAVIHSPNRCPPTRDEVSLLLTRWRDLALTTLPEVE